MIIKKLNSFRFSVEWKTEPSDLTIFLNLIQNSPFFVDFRPLHSPFVPEERQKFKKGFSFIADQVDYFLPFCFEQQAFNSGKGDLSYLQATDLVDTFVKWIGFLEKKGYTFSQIDPDKIIVIDNKIFLYLGIEHLCLIDKKQSLTDKKQIKITNYFNYDPLRSPEWITQKRLPAYFSYKIVYYNIAMLAGYCLFFHLHNLGEREEEERKDISQTHLLDLFETYFPSTKLTLFFKINTSSFPILLF